MRRHRDDVGGKGFAWLCRATRWKCDERHRGGSALICSGRRRKRRAWRRAARRRRSPAKPRAAKEEICFARRGDGNARLSLDRRRIGTAMSSAAREEQGNSAPRRRRSIGAIGEGWARKRTDPRRTGNGPIRRGVEQPSWDRLRMATAQTRCATSGDGKAKYRSAMAKQSRGMQRRWTDTGSEGVALMSRAWRRPSTAWQGEGKAKHSEARRRHSRAKP